jgi:iron(III) transport system substrate-binding protein
LVAAFAFLFAGGQEEKKGTEPEGEMKVMLYSSMKDSQLSALKEGFMNKNPNVQMDYYTAGTGKVMTKLSAEEQAGNISADILWVGDPTNYFELKERGLLLSYISPEAKTIPADLIDEGNYYCAARIITLGIVYNVNLVKGNDIPRDWDDLLKPRFKGLTVMTDPTFSGTTLYTVAALIQNPKYGWDFFNKLKANGMRLEKGSSAVVNKVGAGEYDLCIGVDYIARSKKAQGTPIDFVHAQSGISTVPSPIAILNATKNPKAAKLLYDYILSLEGQQILIDAQVLPVRPELELEGALSVKETADRALPIDPQLLNTEKDELLARFDQIMKTD